MFKRTWWGRQGIEFIMWTLWNLFYEACPPTCPIWPRQSLLKPMFVSFDDKAYRWLVKSMPTVANENVKDKMTQQHDTLQRLERRHL